jgi:hypothetical protein
MRRSDTTTLTGATRKQQFPAYLNEIKIIAVLSFVKGN